MPPTFYFKSLLTELITREALPWTTVVRTLDALMELGWVVKDSYLLDTLQPLHRRVIYL